MKTAVDVNYEGVTFTLYGEYDPGKEAVIRNSPEDSSPAEAPWFEAEEVYIEVTPSGSTTWDTFKLDAWEMVNNLYLADETPLIQELEEKATEKLSTDFTLSGRAV